jgi:hypothetical protein
MTTETTIAALQAGNAWLSAEVAVVQKTLAAPSALLERGKHLEGQCTCRGPCGARAARHRPTSSPRAAGTTDASGILPGFGGTGVYDGWAPRPYATRGPRLLAALEKAFRGRPMDPCLATSNVII